MDDITIWPVELLKTLKRLLLTQEKPATERVAAAVCTFGAALIDAELKRRRDKG